MSERTHGARMHSAKRHAARQVDVSMQKSSTYESLVAPGTMRALGLTSVRMTATDLRHDRALRQTLRELRDQHIRTLVRKRSALERGTS